VTRWRALALLSAAELAGMSLWFGASAAAPALAARWGLAAADAGRLTLAVQLGFVAGTLVSAIANVSDVFPPRRVFAISAVMAAIAAFPDRGALADTTPSEHFRPAVILNSHRWT